MIRLRTLGLALVAVFAMGAVAAASASAAPEWKLNGIVLTSPSAVTSKGTLKLEDTGTGVQVECTGSDKGTIGPKSVDEITEIKVEGPLAKNRCKVLKGTSLCGTEAEAVALNLDWGTALEEPVVNEIRDKITNAGNDPGWEVKCLGGLKASDKCTGDTSTLMHNNTPAAGEVTAEFEAKSAHANCSVGGTGTGVVTGTNVIKSAAGAIET